jgi:hypothetical protein
MSKPIPIIKVKQQGMHVHDLVSALPHLEPGTKFTLKLKRGKRYKLRSFRIQYHDHRRCECCGPYVVLSFRNSARTIHLDSHFGSSFFGVEQCL